VERFEAHRFSVTRQLRYSRDETRLSLDMAIFINGLPVATVELKNRLTKQTVADAVQQYKRDRDPKELLFQFGRCMVHFAVDDHEVRFCTHLKGQHSWFLPFNKGYNDGAGNPPNPAGLATDYLWKEILTRGSLTEIIENYAQIVEEKDERSGRKSRKQIFPRYHLLAVVRKLLEDVRVNGAGKCYLIQHSAGSGKSNSIAWLAHQLVGLEPEDGALFDSVIVVTDRRVLDKQIRDRAIVKSGVQPDQAALLLLSVLLFTSTSTPSLNFTPSTTLARSLNPRIRRQRFSALIPSLYNIASMVFRLTHPLAWSLRCRIVAKVDSTRFVVRMCTQCSAGKS
jgi:hypothetical protein